MKRFFLKVARFFWSWGFLKFVLWTATLIILFYVEEDWRGARAWASTKAEWEAKGENLDLNAFTPPPVPDNENLTAIPLFKMEPIKDDQGRATQDTYPVTLRKAMHSQGMGNNADLPPRGNWMRGELPDKTRIGNTIAASYASAFEDTPPPGNSLAQFEALYPFLADLRSAAATRPRCRLDLDYTTSPPFGRALGLLTDQMRLSNILTLDAILALDQHQPDLALTDIKINYILLSGAKDNPTLVAGLVAQGMNAICTAAIYDGLSQHAWNDGQLAELEHLLAPINFLAVYQLDFRSEAADSTVNIDFMKRASRAQLFGTLSDYSENAATPRWWSWLPYPWPGGWWDQNKSQMTTFVLRQVATVDPSSGRVFPELNSELQQQADRSKARSSAYAPWNIWVTLALGPMETQMPKFAYAQDWVNKARLACALERHRLAHGVYPDSLDGLVPDNISALPHDVMNGEPYHYQLHPDGTYLLYSIGWNQTDDGGKVVFKKDDPTHIDNTLGDWVWPTPQINPFSL